MGNKVSKPKPITMPKINWGRLESVLPWNVIHNRLEDDRRRKREEEDRRRRQQEEEERRRQAELARRRPPMPCVSTSWNDPVTRDRFQCIDGEYIAKDNGLCPVGLLNIDGVCLKTDPGPRTNYAFALREQKKVNLLNTQANALSKEIDRLNTENRANKIVIVNDTQMEKNEVAVVEGFNIFKAIQENNRRLNEQQRERDRKTKRDFENSFRRVQQQASKVFRPQPKRPPPPPPPPRPCNGDSWKDPVTKQVYECINGKYLATNSGKCPTSLNNYQGVCVSGQPPKGNWFTQLLLARQQERELSKQVSKLTSNVIPLRSDNVKLESEINKVTGAIRKEVAIAEGLQNIGSNKRNVTANQGGLRSVADKAITKSLHDKQELYKKITHQNNTLSRNIEKNTVTYNTEDQKNYYISQSIDSYEKWNRYIFLVYYFLFVISLYFIYATNSLTLLGKIVVILALFVYPHIIYYIESFLYFSFSYLITLIMNQTYEKEKVKT